MDAPLPSFPRASEEDGLLLEALAFIGDLGVDVDDDDELLSVLRPDAPSPALVPAPELGDRFLQPAVSTVANKEDNEAEACGPLPDTVPGPRAPHKWPGESLPQPVPRTDAQASRPTTTRTRRREELLYLRGLVGDLEERLSALRASTIDVASESPSHAPDTPSELVDAWEQVASRQYAQRHQSEMENIKLRRLLNDQIQLGKSLERLLLRKRPNVEAFDQEALAEKRLRRTNSRSRNTELVFEELLANCEALYADTARVLGKFDAIPPVKPRRDVQLIHDAELGMTVQTTEQRIVPFDWEFTADTLWSFLPEGSTVHHFHDYRNTHLTDDTIKLQFRVTSQIGRKRSEFSITMALRRYLEADRTIITVSAVFDPTEIEETAMVGVRMRHSGCHILQPMPSHALRSSRDATYLCVHHISVPDVDGNLKDEARQVGTLSNFLLGAIAIEMESRNQNLDNRLLERSLTRSHSNE